MSASEWYDVKDVGAKAHQVLGEADGVLDIPLLAIDAAEHRAGVVGGVGNLAVAHRLVLIDLAHNGTGDHAHAIERPRVAVLQGVGHVVCGDQVDKLRGDRARGAVRLRGVVLVALADLPIPVTQRVVVRVKDVQVRHGVGMQEPHEGIRQQTAVVGHLDRAVRQAGVKRLNGAKPSIRADLHMHRDGREHLDEVRGGQGFL